VFDLTSDPAHGADRKASLGSSIAAILAHAAVLAAVIAIPVSRAVMVEPEPASIPAFVATPDLLPLPVSPRRAPAAAPPVKSRAASAAAAPAVPTEAPIEIKPEPAAQPVLDAVAGVENGIEGGVAGGIVGGIVGGDTVAPAPPPERRISRAAPLRVSGGIKPPDLLHRVDPVYSPIAAASRLSGTVILEAVVDAEGSIESIKMVRGSNPLLDKAATDALKQWKYEPLMLAGVPTPFVVNATFKFRYPDVGASTAASY